MNGSVSLKFKRGDAVVAAAVLLCVAALVPRAIFGGSVTAPAFSLTGALAAGTLQKLPRAVWEKGGAPCWNRS